MSEPETTPPMTDIELAVLRVAAERNTDGETFVDRVWQLIEEVRNDERAKCSAEHEADVEERIRAALEAERSRPADPAKAGPKMPPRRLTDADRAEIARRAETAERTPRGHVVRGWKESVARDLGLTKSQVNTALQDLRAEAA